MLGLSPKNWSLTGGKVVNDWERNGPGVELPRKRAQHGVKNARGSGGQKQQTNQRTGSQKGGGVLRPYDWTAKKRKKLRFEKKIR